MATTPTTTTSAPAATPETLKPRSKGDLVYAGVDAICFLIYPLNIMANGNQMQGNKKKKNPVDQKTCQAVLFHLSCIVDFINQFVN